MRSPGWRRVAELGLAHWLSGNLYEAAVDVPLLVSRGDPTGVLGRGSPVRYYLPAPVTLAATAVTVVDGWRSGDDRRALVAAGAGVVVAVALTGHLVRTVNIPLLRKDSTAARSRSLGAHWHRVNVARLAALAVTIGGLRYSTGHHAVSSDHR